MSILAGKDGWRPGMAIAGAAGAIVSLEETIVGRGLFGTSLDLLVGLWFGLALAGYFAIITRDRSIWKAVSLTLVSAGAYWLAFLATFSLESSLGHPADQAVRAHTMPLFAGGVIGAFVLSTTTFLLYGDTRERLPQKILVCSVLGGVLGAAGYEIGYAMQSGTPSEAYSTSVLFVVWQTGMGLVMGIVWPAGVPARGAAPPTAASVADAAAPSRRDRHRVPLWAKVFMVAVVLPLAWAAIGGARARYRAQQAEIALNTYRAQRPSLNGLPAIVARSDDQVMILTAIADHPAHSLGYRVKHADGDLPEIAEYTVCYMNHASEICGATPPAVDVRVTQYPTAEWARYALKGTSAVGGYGGGLGREAVVIKFGQSILQPTLLGPPSDVYWASGVYVVRVLSNIPNADEFIRAYLERHPSSL